MSDNLKELYIECVIETDWGWFAILMHPSIDGNFADVYGEDREDAWKNASDLIDAINKQDAMTLIKRIAEWSKKYPRSSIYNARARSKMDSELIEMEKEALRIMEE